MRNITSHLFTQQVHKVGMSQFCPAVQIQSQWNTPGSAVQALTRRARNCQAGVLRQVKLSGQWPSRTEFGHHCQKASQWINQKRNM